MTTDAPYPHCNAEVLHAPGVCVYCDEYPDRQRARVASRTPFTSPGANGWQGNIAWTPQMVADEANYWETVAKVHYGPDGSDEIRRLDDRWVPGRSPLIHRLYRRIKRWLA